MMSGARWPAALSLIFASCGSVGEPLPPLLNIPAPIEDLRVRQEASRIVAEWTVPELTTEGSTLRDAVTVELYALDFAADSPPPPPDVFERLAEPIAETESGRVLAGVHDRYGAKTAFAARVVSARGKMSPWSDYVILDVIRPPDAPVLGEAVVEADKIRLSWSPVDGASGYRVERRVEGEETFREVGRVEQPEFEDRLFVWDREHVYRVRAEAASPTGAVPSDPSEERSVTPVDVFAPPVPTGLRSVVTPASIELTWDSLTAGDLAGYRVLRNGEPAHDGLIETPAFSDSPAPQGDVEYAVVAVDRNGNESEPSKPHRPR